jgi:hypothetical protein
MNKESKDFKTSDNPFKDLNEFVARIDDLKKKEKMDLSSDQDLTLAIMNLVSIEEHFFFTGAKTGKTKYYDLIEDVREIRKELLQEIIKDYEGEVWCISKHLLAASMRLFEVGTKQLSLGKKEKAYAMFQKAYDLYGLFWGINMNVISTKEIKKIDDMALNNKDASRKGVMGKLGELVRKVIDCCIE